MFAKRRQEGGRPSVDEIIAQNTSPLSVPKRRGAWLNFFLLILVIALTSSLIKVYFEYRSVKDERDQAVASAKLVKTDPLNLSDEDLLVYLADRADLPGGTSTVATVKDVDNLKLKDKFFERAQNGDKILLFSGVGLLFRAATDKIITFGPINDSATANTNTEQPATNAPTENLTIEIRNGSQTAGLASKWKQTLSAEKNYQVSKIGNASRDDYSQTYIVNLSSKSVAALESKFNVKAVSELPSGESTSTAEVLIILGPNN